MKKILSLLLVGLSFFSLMASGEEIQPGEVHTYGMHLFFTEREFIDVFTLYLDEDGRLQGDMHVPDDFDGPLLNTKIDGLKISFDLFVPKNSARPKDLIFHYEGTFHSEDKRELIGFVRIKGQEEFIASFVAFKR